MNTLKSIIAAGLVSMSAVVQSCTAKEMTPAYGNIGYEGAKVYTDAAGKQTSGNTLNYGEIVEFDADNSSRFVYVKNIATGTAGYVDTLQINRAQYPMEAPFAFDEEQTEAALLNIETGNGGETTDGWALWNENGKIRALNSVTTVSNDGRMRTFEHYYIGESKPGYVILTHEVQYGEEEGDTLDTPIVIYEDIAGRAGIFVNGKIFTPGGQQGGFDTDDWE